jgi:hypothetical protein
MNIMFPHTFDSTMISSLRSCQRKGYLQYFEHWKPKAKSVHLVAGGAFASGIEAARKGFYCEGMTQLDAQAVGLMALIKHYGDFECPADSAKSLERMCGALEFYFETYPMGDDGADPITFPNGQRGIEFSFAEPLPICHPVSGDPILYTGRSDMIAHRASGIYLYDEKTTTALGASWARQWEHRSQFTGYAWAALQQGIKTNGTVIRGVSILKTKYDTLEVLTHRTPFELDRWLDQTVRDIRRAINSWKEGHWDFNLDGACNEYGGCPFTQVCKSDSPQDWLPMSFEQRVWDPLAREELTIQQHEESWGHGIAPGEVEGLLSLGSSGIRRG